jgi:RNA polymerase-binding transcription factor DksA
MSSTATSAQRSQSNNGDSFAQQRAAIIEERQACLQQIAALDGDLAILRDRDGASDVDFTEEGGEGDTLAVERDREESLRSTLLARLGELDAAQLRIEEGTYGVCQSCGGPIGEARLEALPDATECVSCKGAGPLRRRPLSR